MERSTLVSPYVMWTLIAVGITISWIILPARYLWHRTYAEGLVADVLLCYWLVMVLMALRENSAAATSAANVRRLITTGPYALVRHPIYSGDIAAALALMLIAPNVRMIGFAAAAIVIFLTWMGLEERALLGRFGDEYRRYRQRIPRFVPLPRKHPAP